MSCEQAKTLRSEQSNKAAKIRFVNEFGATLIIQWIDFKGALKEYAELKPGAELTQETYVTHPWIAAYQEGSCRQLFLPAPGIVGRAIAAEFELSNKATTVRQPPYSKRSDDADPPLKCAKNYKKIGGKCVLLQNCGANAYRSSEGGDCSCNKNYRMQNGECVLKQAVKCSRTRGLTARAWGNASQRLQCARKMKCTVRAWANAFQSPGPMTVAPAPGL